MGFFDTWKRESMIGRLLTKEAQIEEGEAEIERWEKSNALWTEVSELICSMDRDTFNAAVVPEIDPVVQDMRAKWGEKHVLQWWGCKGKYTGFMSPETWAWIRQIKECPVDPKDAATPVDPTTTDARATCKAYVPSAPAATLPGTTPSGTATGAAQVPAGEQGAIPAVGTYGPTAPATIRPGWHYVAGGLAIAGAGVLLGLLVRAMKK